MSEKQYDINEYLPSSVKTLTQELPPALAYEIQETVWYFWMTVSNPHVTSRYLFDCIRHRDAALTLAGEHAGKIADLLRSKGITDEVLEHTKCFGFQEEIRFHWQNIRSLPVEGERVREIEAIESFCKSVGMTWQDVGVEIEEVEALKQECRMVN